MLGLTIRESDPDKQRIVMGQAVLKIHEFDGVEWKSDGFWCQDTNENDVPLPITEQGEVEYFQKEWKITRTNEPGLSVVVPYVVDLKWQSLFQAVAINFFAAILRQELIVEINAPGIGLLLLSDKTIEEECRKNGNKFWDGPQTQKRHTPPPIVFAKECIDKADNAVSSLLLGENTIPNLSPESFNLPDLELIRTEFAKGNLVAVKIRVFLPAKKKENSEEDSFFVFLKKEVSSEVKPDSYYVREGMTITKINSSRAKRNNTRGIVYIDKGPLASLLGDTEGPAHEDWLPSQHKERADRIWASGWVGRVNFVKRIIDNFYDIVCPPNKEVDHKSLSPFFSIEKKGVSTSPTDDDMTKGINPKPVEEVTDVTLPFDSPEPKPNWYAIQPKHDGFRVFHAHRELFPTIPAGAILKIELAYDVSKGNALKKWNENDFDLRKDTSTKKGEKRLLVKGKGKGDFLNGNTVVLREIPEEFFIEITGFDLHRDLLVAVTEQQEDNKEQDQ